MKATLPSALVAVILSTTLILSGCQKETAVGNSETSRKVESPDTTKPLQAADIVGYDGTKLKKSVDQIRASNDKRNREINKMLESGPDQ